MFWIITTASVSALGMAVTVASMALWVRRLRPLKVVLTSSRMFREKPWITSDTGFLIFSELFVDWSVGIFYAATLWASLSALFAPEQTLISFLIVSGMVLFRSITLSIWTHVQAKAIHHEPEDDGSGVYGMAEINWIKRRNLNAFLAGLMCILTTWLWLCQSF